MSDCFIIVVGNPIEGFVFYGSFPSKEDAAEYANINVTQEEWWIAELNPAEMLED